MSRPSPRERFLSNRNVANPTAQPVSPVPMLAARLSRAQLADLESRFPPRPTDNPTLAAQYLGQQQVLNEIRKNFSD